MGLTSAVFDSLNKVSGAIIAMATATSAAATVALIYWTSKYVRLTRHLVASTAEHVQHTIREQKEKLDANRQGLHELTKIILITLNKLPTSRDRAADMIGVTLWSVEDLLDMRHLARGLSGKVIGNVFWAIYHLNAIGEWVRQAQQKHREKEIDLAEFLWEDYAGTLQQAKQELSHLLELL
ncbi:MAG: hypothetical protein LAO31_03460 [Acidobacteriia bacterium]|nr:hypothetical protein [Terriglobia bacterium]